MRLIDVDQAAAGAAVGSAAWWGDAFAVDAFVNCDYVARHGYPSRRHNGLKRMFGSAIVAVAACGLIHGRSIWQRKEKKATKLVTF